MRMTDGNYEERDMSRYNSKGECMEQISLDALNKLYPESDPLTYPSIKEVKSLPVEAVNHPSHYQGNNYECIDVMLDNYGKEQTLSWIKLNIFKYNFLFLYFNLRHIYNRRKRYAFCTRNKYYYYPRR